MRGSGGSSATNRSSRRFAPTFGFSRSARSCSISAGNDRAAAAYMSAICDSAVIANALEGALAFEWAPVRMVSDEPAKGLGLAPAEDLFPQRLRQIVGDPMKELQLVSPYFVPTAAGVEFFTRLAREAFKDPGDAGQLQRAGLGHDEIAGDDGGRHAGTSESHVS